MQGELERLIAAEDKEGLTASQRKVIKHHRERKIVSTDAHAEFLAEATLGNRLSDAIARIGGSWGFIIGFAIFLVCWALANTVLLVARPFDPYPFIFLNLLLSMVAALQAPVIMMSQNRQAARDRFMAAKDYEVNLKAELEVLGLHQKIDLEVLKELREMQQQVSMLMDEIKALKSDR